MSPHPCAGHPCDHCYLCDVVGICCLTVRGVASAASSVSRPDSDEALRQAVIAETERQTDPRLLDVIRAEALRAGRPQALLPPAPESMSLPVLDHLKGAHR